MPAALSIRIRQEIVERRQRKESFVHISEEMSISYDTVRAIWQHWQKHGELAPHYEACRHPGPRKPQAVYEAALSVRREHPRWGALVVRLHLLEEFNEEDVPAERTLQSWFRKAGLNRAPAKQQKQEYVRRGQQVHEVWAVDAKEKMKLADQSGASWLTITDEASGAILDTQAFPPISLGKSRSNPRQETSSEGIRAVGASGKDAL